MKKVYFISDTHFGHGNIIGFHNRPFKNAREMDKKMIENWNHIVEPNDMVWFLGDIALYGRHESNKDMVRKIVNKLNGKKKMIIGNHDPFGKEFYKECGFMEVHNESVRLGQYILSHRPLDAFKEKYNIHGHIHSLSVGKPEYVNVSVEVIDYKPISFDEIKRKLKIQEMTKK